MLLDEREEDGDEGEVGCLGSSAVIRSADEDYWTRKRRTKDKNRAREAKKSAVNLTAIQADVPCLACGPLN